MFPLFPTLVTGDDWLDPCMRERLVLGRGRWHLAQMLAFECTPGRIVRFGRSGFDLEGPFPGGIVSTHDLADPRPTPSSDVVWCDFALSAAPDPARAIARLWEEVRDGARLAVVDVHRVSSERMERWLGKEVGLRTIPGLLAGLRAAFEPLHTSVLDHQGGAWQSVVMIGRKRPARG